MDSNEFSKADELFELAHSYFSGTDGMPVDYEKAISLLNEAIDLGSADALGLLGFCYAHGYGVEENHDIATEYYRRGAIAGDAFSEFTLGKSYLWGAGIEINTQEGLFWLKKAADQEMEQAIEYLGELYAEGDYAVSQSSGTAINYFLKIVNSDDDEIKMLANKWLGTIHSLNLNDHATAFKYWLTAAELGDITSQENLGLMYGNGWGTEINFPQARYWFEKAAQQGSEKAKQCISTLDEQTRASTNSSSGGCYIATAVYGSYDCPEVWTLRRYRDNTLAETWYGRAFIRTYYAISPTLVKWFGDTSWFKRLWKNRLDSMVKKLNSEGYDDSPYNDQ